MMALFKEVIGFYFFSKTALLCDIVKSNVNNMLFDVFVLCSIFLILMF